MYEGKNIHFSALDKKPLCSFSAKVCNQHRLNGYGFCVRHILEDPTAPFKRCAYVAKSSKQTCTQAIPQHEDREYCNNHMQVLGMLPRKERKPKKEKEKPIETVMPIAREKKKLFEDRVKSRFNTSKLINNDILGRDTGFGEDPDDPYAFPDPSGDAKSSGNMGNMSLPSMSPYSEAPLSVGSQGSHGSKSPGDGGGGVSSIAKLYPELAEKLEKIKPKFDTGAKMKDKGKVKSSRTMNRLQTKIAQNKIKDKLKKNQESNSQSQSPCHGFGSIGNMMQLTNNCNHYDSEVTERTLHNSFDSLKNSGSHESALHDTPVTELKRPPVPYSMMQSSPQDVISNLKYPGIGFPGAPHGIPHGMPLESLPGMPNASSRSQQFSNPDPVRMNAFPSPVMMRKSIPPTSLPLNSPQSRLVHQQPVVSVASSSVSPMETHKLNYPVQQQMYQSVPTTHPPPPPPPPYTKGVTEMNSNQISSLPAVSSSCTVTHSGTLTPAVSSYPHPTLPPPPPYRSKSKVQSSKKTKSSIYTPLSSAVIPNLPRSAVTQPCQMKQVLKEDDWPKWMKTESSKNYYNYYLKRKKFNHNLIGAGLKSSDEDSSESEDENLLPWQPQWFTASSDDEAMEDDDHDDAIRTTKLALLRAQVRRQCLQSRRSYRSNTSEHKTNNGSTMALIQAAREGPRATVAVIQRMLYRHQKLVNGLTKSGSDRKKCCYKDFEEVQCKNIVLPLTNHCLKHIMYNVDQQMFDYCTAKFADNTQCCMPVFDIRHELPLCMEHAMKADNYSKDQDGELKQKRPRKKTKPSALTRPPKKGKKKKNQRKQLRPQKPSPPSNPVGLTEMPPLSSAGTESQVGVNSDTADSEPVNTSSQSDETKEIVQEQPPGPSKPVSKPTPVNVVLPPSSVPVNKETPKSSLSELPDSVLDTLNAVSDMDKALELPLEQASRLLEEKDFQEVFNKLPDEAFDIFSGKNGDYEPTNEEVEELERHLAAANMDVKNAQKTLDSFSLSNVDLDLDEEQLRQITATLFGSGSNSEINSGTSSISGGMCNGQDQENINAIARSLSASEILMGRASNAATLQPTGANTNVYQSQQTSVFTQVPGNTVNGTLQNLTSVAGGTNVIMATQNHVVHSNMDTNAGMGSVTASPINSTSVQLQQQFHNQENYVTNRVLPGQQFPQQSQQHPSIPLHQLVSAASVTGIPNASNVSVSNHITAESLQGNMTNKTHILSNQIPASIPVARVAWPVNLGQLANYQNGYPVHNTFVQSGGDAANLKFHNVNAQHVNHSGHGNMSQELASQQYQLLSHSAGSPNSVMVRAPLQTFTNSTQRPGFKQARLPPPFSATSGNGS